MINATELRIGNYFKIKTTTTYAVTIREIHEDKIKYSFNFGIEREVFSKHCLLCYLKPIPLTEEWLIKFGLKQDSTDKYWYFSPTYNKFYPLYERGIYWGFNGLGLSVNEMQYVHQLQNLYFALRGEELTITE